MQVHKDVIEEGIEANLKDYSNIGTLIVHVGINGLTNNINTLQEPWKKYAKRSKSSLLIRRLFFFWALFSKKVG